MNRHPLAGRDGGSGRPDNSRLGTGSGRSPFRDDDHGSDSDDDDDSSRVPTPSASPTDDLDGDPGNGNGVPNISRGTNPLSTLSTPVSTADTGNQTQVTGGGGGIGQITTTTKLSPSSVATVTKTKTSIRSSIGVAPSTSGSSAPSPSRTSLKPDAVQAPTTLPSGAVRTTLNIGSIFAIILGISTLLALVGNAELDNQGSPALPSTALLPSRSSNRWTRSTYDQLLSPLSFNAILDSDSKSESNNGLEDLPEMEYFNGYSSVATHSVEHAKRSSIGTSSVHHTRTKSILKPGQLDSPLPPLPTSSKSIKWVNGPFPSPRPPTDTPEPISSNLK
ncbi:hypothetical protein CVT24_009367 [Panaeolus cyanescens]|uniref:Uncharacterized protein n=1 Tax=Panaeolus cyanescens TaxID=181874 RepID=A0A409Y7N7_9AGAR|nr:hypothetical protein CVT24_009367 [Panaeolus cyanescens]